jgi:hypothetical protein
LYGIPCPILLPLPFCLPPNVKQILLENNAAIENNRHKIITYKNANPITIINKELKHVTKLKTIRHEPKTNPIITINPIENKRYIR